MDGRAMMLGSRDAEMWGAVDEFGVALRLVGRGAVNTSAGPMDDRSNDPLVAVGLAKQYRSRQDWALDGIDLSFRRGAITGLIGPNGAGKSTLLRTFMGFETPTRGRALVVGLEARKDRARALRHVGYVSQEASLYRDLTVGDHLAMAAVLRRGFDRESARRRLGDLGLPLDARAGELSGGQRAQVALALALGTRAPILLLDEPIASLDPIARQDFLGMLSESVAGAGSTVVIASHIVAELEGVCDDIVVLAPARVMLQDRIDHARATHALPKHTSFSRLQNLWLDMLGQKNSPPH